MSITTSLLKLFRSTKSFLAENGISTKRQLMASLLISLVFTIPISGVLYAVGPSDGLFRRDTHKMSDAGAFAISLGAVKAQSLEHDAKFFWIGKSSSNQYSTEVLNPDSVTINYLSRGSTNSNVGTPILSIETYKNPNKYIPFQSGPLKPTSDVYLFNNRGDSLVYNRSDLCRIVITLADNSEVIIMRYAKDQSEQKLVEDSEKIAQLV